MAVYRLRQAPFLLLSAVNIPRATVHPLAGREESGASRLGGKNMPRCDTTIFDDAARNIRSVLYFATRQIHASAGQGSGRRRSGDLTWKTETSVSLRPLTSPATASLQWNSIADASRAAWDEESGSAGSFASGRMAACLGAHPLRGFCNATDQTCVTCGGPSAAWDL
jgi:hypothetical protein